MQILKTSARWWQGENRLADTTNRHWTWHSFEQMLGVTGSKHVHCSSPFQLLQQIYMLLPPSYVCPWRDTPRLFHLIERSYEINGCKKNPVFASLSMWSTNSNIHTESSICSIQTSQNIQSYSSGSRWSDLPMDPFFSSRHPLESTPALENKNIPPIYRHVSS